MKADLHKEHQWLERLEGYWGFEMEAQETGPGETAQTYEGTEHVRLLGGAWAHCEARAVMSGGDVGQTVTTLGYDPARECFVGTFIASMTTHLWVYEGHLSADGESLVLDTEGPDFQGSGRLVKYQDEIAFVAPDHRVLRSRVLSSDGTWTTFMTVHYRRAKPTQEPEPYVA